MKTKCLIGIGLAVITLGLSAVTSSADTPVDAAVSGAMAVKPYTLSVGDTLDITVQGHDELKAAVTVLPDGSFSYPIVGTVHAAGLTVEQLNARIQKGLSRQINGPDVNIIVVNTLPRKISVLGAVKAPGLYDYKPGWRLLDALAACGGPAQSPELTQLSLVTDDGKTTTPIDIVKLMSGADPAQNPPLAPQDVLLVQQRDPSVAQVQVTGEVTKPGTYSVPVTGASVLSVLTQAGGPSPKAALTQANLMHNGEVRVINLRPLMSGLSDPAGDVKVVAGDVLLIPANISRIAVLGEVHLPATYDIPDGGILPVTAALALAGGPTNTANKKSANIIRRGPDGQPVIVPINIDDLLQGKKTASNVALEPGDILYVPTKGQASFRPLDALSFIPLFNLLRYGR